MSKVYYVSGGALFKDKEGLEEVRNKINLLDMQIETGSIHDVYFNLSNLNVKNSLKPLIENC